MSEVWKLPRPWKCCSLHDYRAREKKMGEPTGGGLWGWEEETGRLSRMPQPDNSRR